jgi:hypothetical protein
MSVLNGAGTTHSKLPMAWIVCPGMSHTSRNIQAHGSACIAQGTGNVKVEPLSSSLAARRFPVSSDVPAVLLIVRKP